MDEKGRAAIHLAVKVGSLECVKILGDKYNAPLNLAANDGFTPLLVAVVAQPNHMSDIIDALLREGKLLALYIYVYSGVYIIYTIYIYIYI